MIILENPLSKVQLIVKKERGENLKKKKEELAA